MRILLIRLSSLGDVVLATPVARLLRARFPDAEIDVAVGSDYADVWRWNPRIDRVIAVDRSLSATAMAMAIGDTLARRYDLVVDLQRSLRSYAIRRGRASALLRYSKHRLEKLALVWLKKRPARVVHVAERYIRALNALGISDDAEGLEFWLPHERSEPIYPPSRRSTPTDRVLGIAPGARHATKQWLPERFAAVARAFQERGWRVVLFGSTTERTLCESIARQLDSHRVINAAGCSLIESASNLDACRVVLSNDSGIAHLAAARRVPIAVVYGSTVPEFGFRPFRVPHHIVEAAIGCRPCTHIGRTQCPRGHFACMRSIEPALVIGAIEHLAAEAGVP